MRWMDYLLQRWRNNLAAHYIRPGEALLDVGCYDGWLLARVQARVSLAVGLDRKIPEGLLPERRNQLILSDTTTGLPFPDQSFSSVSLLAVFEHLHQKAEVVQEISRILRPAGRVILTVPGRQIDGLLDILITLGVADGMALEEHHGFQAADTPALFEAAGFVLLKWQRFQLGLNNLFVFEKTTGG
jgi:SAM-dependent methyltransferase